MLGNGRRRAEQCNQFVPAHSGGGVATGGHQPGAPLGMIHHQRPVIDTHGHVWDLLGVLGQHRQALDASAEVVAEPADGAAAKGQAWDRLAVDAESLAQQRERVFAGQLAAVATAQLGEAAAGDQGQHRIGRQDVVAAMRAERPAAVEKRGPGAVRERLEQQRAVRVIGKFSQSLHGSIQLQATPPPSPAHNPLPPRRRPDRAGLRPSSRGQPR